MSYSVRNIKKQPIIGNLGDGSELRLPVGASITISDKQFRGYVEGLAEMGDVEVIELEARTADNTEVVKAVDKASHKKAKKED